MLYAAYEFQRQLATPVRLWANALEQVYSSPYNPLTDTWFGKSVAAGAEIMARLTQNYGKPEFGLKTTRSATRPSRSTKRSCCASRSASFCAFTATPYDAIPRCWWWRR